MASDPVPARPNRRRRMLGDEVFEMLGRAIRDGRLAPGASLRDVDLAEQFGVSRTPVREALQRLERIGLVEIAANRFTRVTVRTPRAVADTRAYIVGLTTQAMRLALPTCSSAHLDAVVAAFDRMTETRLDDPGHTDASSAFFRILTMATQNVVLGRIVREASLTLERNLHGWAFIDVTTDAGRTARDEIRAALVARDPDTADRVLRSYDASR